MESWNVPEHVPPELVVDIDVFDIPGGRVDPATAWRSFQGSGPLAYSPRYGGHWIATHGQDIPKLYQDFKHLSSRQVVIPDPGNILLPIQADPPLHSQYRSTIAPLLDNAAVNGREKEIRDLTVSLIEGFRKDGECDFVNQFGLQLPLLIFLKMMGLPTEDLRYLRGLVDTFTSSPDVEQKRSANIELSDYLNGWIDRRIAEPENDGLTAVIRGTVEGRPYTREEMLSHCVMLMLAGLDTVANMLAFIAHHLATHPEDRQYIRDNHDKMPQIVQELLRRFPVANIGRVIAEDWEYRGVQLKKGDRIILPVSLYNLDPEHVSQPEKVDFSRPVKHITFGSGRHTCAGAILARKEITIFLEEWLNRIPDFEVDPARPPKFIAMAANSVYGLWLKWPRHSDTATLN